MIAVAVATTAVAVPVTAVTAVAVTAAAPARQPETIPTRGGAWGPPTGAVCFQGVDPAALPFVCLRVG